MHRLRVTAAPMSRTKCTELMHFVITKLPLFTIWGHMTPDSLNDTIANSFSKPTGVHTIGSAASKIQADLNFSLTSIKTWSICQNINKAQVRDSHSASTHSLQSTCENNCACCLEQVSDRPDNILSSKEECQIAE